MDIIFLKVTKVVYSQNGCQKPDCLVNKIIDNKFVFYSGFKTEIKLFPCIFLLAYQK